MLLHLPLDIYSVIVKYITPTEFQDMFVACDNNNIIQDYLKQYCIVKCKTIIANELVNWFEENNIKVQLLRECVKNVFGEKYYTNGKLHSENDEPAHIYTLFAIGHTFSLQVKVWYKNGLRHRDHGPAWVRSDGQFEYYQNGIMIQQL
jgi:hypothetical protein